MPDQSIPLSMPATLSSQGGGHTNGHIKISQSQDGWPNVAECTTVSPSVTGGDQNMKRASEKTLLHLLETYDAIHQYTPLEDFVETVLNVSSNCRAGGLFERWIQSNETLAELGQAAAFLGHGSSGEIQKIALHKTQDLISKTHDCSQLQTLLRAPHIPFGICDTAWQRQDELKTQNELQALLASGSSAVLEADRQGNSPLVRAVQINDLYLLSALVDAGADPNQTDE